MKLVCFLITWSVAWSSFAEIFARCPHELYGTTISGPSSESHLLRLSSKTGASNIIAPIFTNTGHGVNQVTGISFHQNGKMYAVGNDSNNVSSLMLINCRTGVATIIGPTGIPAATGLGITDVSFDKNNVLWAYLNKPGSSSDEVGIIDIYTGVYTAVGDSSINDIGNGIAHAKNNTLYHAGKLNLSTIASNGAASAIAALTFSFPSDTNPRINAMDVRPTNGTMYVAINDKANSTAPAENYLGTVNLYTGVVSFLSANPIRVDNLAGLAFNPQHRCIN